MNIRKFLNKIILISAALFWAGCSNDSVTKATSDNEDATANSDTPTTDSGSSTIGNKSSSSTHTESSSSSSLNYSNCRPIDPIWPIDYRDETYKEDPRKAAKESANWRAQIDIHDSVLERIFHVKYYDEGYKTIFFPYTTTFCLFKMADTLAHRNAPLYGAPPDGSIAKSVYCPDGTTHFTEEYLSYEEDLKAHEKEVKAYEEQKAAYEEAYDKYYEEYRSKKSAELMTLLDSCVNHPGDFKLADKDEEELYCYSLESSPPRDSLEFYDSGICLKNEYEEEEETSSSSKKVTSSSSAPAESSSSEKTVEAKSSSSSKKNNEGDFHGEFAKTGL